MYSKKLMALHFLTSSKKGMEYLENFYDDNRDAIKTHVTDFFGMDDDEHSLFENIESPLLHDVSIDLMFHIDDEYNKLIESHDKDALLMQQYIQHKVGSNPNEVRFIYSKIAECIKVDCDDLFELDTYADDDDSIFENVIDMLYTLKKRDNLNSILDVDYDEFKDVLFAYLQEISGEFDNIEITKRSHNKPNNDDFYMKIGGMNIFGGNDEIDIENFKDMLDDVVGQLRGALGDIIQTPTPTPTSSMSTEPSALDNLNYPNARGVLAKLDDLFNGKDTYSESEVSLLNVALEKKTLKDVFDELILHVMKRYDGNPITIIKQLAFKVANALGIDIAIIDTSVVDEQTNNVTFDTIFGKYNIIYKKDFNMTRENFRYVYSGF